MASRAHAPVRSGDVVDVVIDRLAAGGRGVARHEGFVLFVGRALPGDKVRARVTRVKRSFAEAIAEEVLEEGPTRSSLPVRTSVRAVAAPGSASTTPRSCA